MKKVSLEIAKEEITRWLDFKKVSESKREVNKETISLLEEGVADGYLVVNEDHTLTHNLKFPIEGELPIKSLTYKPRITVGELQAKNKKQGTDLGSMIIGYAAAISSQNTGVIKKLDTDDYSITQAVALFFV
jgi:hypothetical protein